MKIVGLLENTAALPGLKSKHGLSLYIETEKHKILFDMGPNDLFLKNAKSLGIDVSEVDVAIVSHGHVDHCGGLECFLKQNDKAKIYIRKSATDKHYVKVLGIPFYAGINRKLLFEDRFVFTGDTFRIDDELTLFSNVRGSFLLPKSDGNLFRSEGGKIVPDDFCHEQNLVVTEGDKKVLFCGCAHAGIVNISDKEKSLFGDYPFAVFGGFHLFEPTSKRYEDDTYVASVAEALKKTGARYFTCHCTGPKAYEKMKAVIGDKLEYLHTGSEFEI